jgi:hypothetical protein
MPATLKLEIVTPEAVTFSKDVEMVTLPGIDGEMGIYPMHVPLMTQVVAGEVIVRSGGADMFLVVGESESRGGPKESRGSHAGKALRRRTCQCERSAGAFHCSTKRETSSAAWWLINRAGRNLIVDEEAFRMPSFDCG